MFSLKAPNYQVILTSLDNRGRFDTTMFERRLRECAQTVLKTESGVYIVSAWLGLDDLYRAIAFDAPLCSVLSIQPLDPPPPSILLAA